MAASFEVLWTSSSPPHAGAAFLDSVCAIVTARVMAMGRSLLAESAGAIEKTLCAVLSDMRDSGEIQGDEVLAADRTWFGEWRNSFPRFPLARLDVNDASASLLSQLPLRNVDANDDVIASAVRLVVMVAPPAIAVVRPPLAELIIHAPFGITSTVAYGPNDTLGDIAERVVAMNKSDILVKVLFKHTDSGMNVDALLLTQTFATLPDRANVSVDVSILCPESDQEHICPEIFDLPDNYEDVICMLCGHRLTNNGSAGCQSGCHWDVCINCARDMF